MCDCVRLFETFKNIEGGLKTIQEDVKTIREILSSTSRLCSNKGAEEREHNNNNNNDDDDMQSMVSSFGEKDDDDDDSNRQAAEKEYRNLLLEWEKDDEEFVMDKLFEKMYEWVEFYHHSKIFKEGTEAQKTIKKILLNLQGRIFFSTEQKLATLTNFLIGRDSETFCKEFNIEDNGYENLETFLLRESSVSMVEECHRRCR